jgi:hypothetical protein
VYNDLSLPISTLPELLEVCATLFGISFSCGAIETIRSAQNNFTERTSVISQQALTLVHGDFHQKNLICTRKGDIKIVDWGSSGLNIPQWDLVMLNKTSIEQYIGHTAALNRSDPNLNVFKDVLRAAKIVRFFHFLSGALNAIFTGGCGHEEFLRRLPFFADLLANSISEILV